MLTPESVSDPSHDSHYVDEALYSHLVELSADWSSRGRITREERPSSDVREDCATLIYAEARYADGLELDDWLACYASECIYWIPASYPAADPRQEITHEIHDRRRLEDRVARVQTGFAYSMIPPIRTTHVLGNFESWQSGDGKIRARSRFIIDALNKDSRRVLSGWIGYSLVNVGGEWRIAVKQINLIDANYPQENNSFFL